MNIIHEITSIPNFLSFMKERNSLVYKIVDFILISLFILYNAGSAPQLANSLIVIFTFVFSACVFLYRKCKINKFFYLFIAIWGIINLISYNVNTIDKVNIGTFIGWSLRMTMPYFIIKSIGVMFFSKLFNYAFVLVVISLPLFAMEHIFPSVFSKIAPMFHFITDSEQAQAGGFYSFVFMHNKWGAEAFRNSGFMWEPGAYSCILIFLLYYHWFTNGIKLDVKTVIIIIAPLTTFSTAGYLSLFFAVILFLLSNNWNPFIVSLLIIVFVIGSVKFYNESDFMSKKIELHIKKGTDTYNWSFEDKKLIRISRLGIIVVSVDNAIHRPWGEGVFFSDYIIKKYDRVSGPSSIADILRIWGWLGIVILLFSLINFASMFTKNKLAKCAFVISMFIVLSSNPFIIKYLIYGIFFYVYTYKKYLKTEF